MSQTGVGPRIDSSFFSLTAPSRPFTVPPALFCAGCTSGKTKILSAQLSGRVAELAHKAFCTATGLNFDRGAISRVSLLFAILKKGNHSREDDLWLWHKQKQALNLTTKIFDGLQLFSVFTHVDRKKTEK